MKLKELVARVEAAQQQAPEAADAVEAAQNAQLDAAAKLDAAGRCKGAPEHSGLFLEGWIGLYQSQSAVPMAAARAARAAQEAREAAAELERALAARRKRRAKG
ncbi:MAG: hypothetical protein M0031_00415 [Thermaerobacter sp.]|jgi:hypothetical protein|nr:hypothetical protein [Thermaerobacter sp.]